jgi:hypothetical protein
MDETRRDQTRDDARRVGSDPGDADDRADRDQPRERGAERPGLTERERQERWPVG